MEDDPDADFDHKEDPKWVGKWVIMKTNPFMVQGLRDQECFAHSFESKTGRYLINCEKGAMAHGEHRTEFAIHPTNLRLKKGQEEVLPPKEEL